LSPLFLFGNIHSHKGDVEHFFTYLLAMCVPSFKKMSI
jgi:hypothetical protein